MGKSHPERKLTFVNWLKALALSPGILFSAGYLAMYLLTNAYLNNEFKDTILQEIESATENRYTFSVEHLRAGIDLRSVTLKNLELRSVKKQHEGENNSNISIRNLYIKEHINLCNLLFSKQCVERSTREISRQILDTNHLLVFSLRQ